MSQREARATEPHRFHRAARLACVAVIAIASADWLGYALGVGRLTSWVDESPPMPPWTALLLALLAAAVLLQIDRRSGATVWLARALLAVVLAIAMPMVVEYAIGVDLGLDDALFPQALDTAATDWAGRPAFQALLAIIALVPPVMLLGGGGAWSRAARPWLLTLASVLPALALAGYLFDVAQLASLGGLSRVTPPAVAALVLLVLALVAARPDQAPLDRILTRADRTALLRVLVALLGFPSAVWIVRTALSSIGADDATAWGLAVIGAAAVVGVVVYRLSEYQQQALLQQATLVADLGKSEERFRLVAENASDVVTFVSNEAEMLWISPSITALIGWTPEEVAARPFKDTFVHPDDRAALARFQAHMVEGELDAVEMRVLCKDGGYRWVSVLGRPVLDEQGRVAGRTAGWRDIQAEVEARGALAESERRFRILAESASDVVSFLADDGRGTWVSPSVETQTGWTSAEFTARPFEEFVPPEHQATLVEMRQQVRGHRRQARGLVQIRTRDGRLRWISLVATPVLDAAGAVVGRTLSWRDVQKEVEGREALAESEQRFRLVAETASDIVYAVGPDRRVTWVSPSVTRALGWEPQDLIGTVMSDLVHPEDMIWSEERRTRLYAGDPAAEQEGGFVLRLRTRDGDYRWVTTTLAVLRDDAGAVLGFTGGMSIVDELVRERQRLAEEEELQRQAADALLDPQVLLEPVRDSTGAIGDFRYVHANRAMVEASGRTREEVIGASLLQLPPDVGVADIVASCAHVVETGVPLVCDGLHRLDPRHDGDVFHDVRATRVPGGRVILTWRDVSDVHRARQVLERRATYDDLTGALKREPALERLASLAASARASGVDTGVLFIDLDEFKTINDTRGHAAGDEVLRAIATRIRAAVRSGDVVARLGGDEFLVILEEIHDLAAATAVAEKIRRSGSWPIAIGDERVTITLSIGVVLARRDEAAEAMIMRADAAMYEAKRSGRDQVIAIPG